MPSYAGNDTLERSIPVLSGVSQMPNAAKYVWVDDGLKDAAQASVPVVNAGLHYGYTVFEGIRCYATDRGPAVLRMEEHVDRLLDSAQIVGFRDLAPPPAARGTPASPTPSPPLATTSS